MSDYKKILAQLYKNLAILREREAKYGSNPPLDLLNQIDDHEQAIILTEQANQGKIIEADWRESLRPLLVNIRDRSESQPEICGVIIGDVAGGIIGSIIAGGDVSNVQIVQASNSGTATVNVSTFDQRGQKVNGDQYNAGRDIHIDQPPKESPAWRAWTVFLGIVSIIGVIIALFTVPQFNVLVFGVPTSTPTIVPTSTSTTHELCSEMLADTGNITSNHPTSAPKLPSTEIISSTKIIFSLNTATKDMISTHKDAVYDWKVGGPMVICARNFDAVLINPKLPKNFRAFVQFKIDDPSTRFYVALFKAGSPARNFSIAVSSKDIIFFPPTDGDTKGGTKKSDEYLLAQPNVTSNLSIERTEGVLTIYSNSHKFTFSEEENVNQYNYLLLTAGSTNDTSQRLPGKVIIEDIIITEL